MPIPKAITTRDYAATSLIAWPLGPSAAEALRVQADSTPAWLGFSINVSGHLLARAVIIPWAEVLAA